MEKVQEYKGLGGDRRKEDFQVAKIEVKRTKGRK